MKITIEPTDELGPEIAGRTRLWKGVMDNGIPVLVQVAAVAAVTDDPRDQEMFEEGMNKVDFMGRITELRVEDMEDGPEFGPCCMCEHAPAVNIIMLDRLGAVPDHGWGCVECGLPWDGAYAVLCDSCLALWQEDESRLTTACRGYPASDGRIPIAELPPGKFEHDMTKHPDG